MDFKWTLFYPDLREAIHLELPQELPSIYEGSLSLCAGWPEDSFGVWVGANLASGYHTAG